ncbi:23S rRNA pseudouridine(2604) synthase RluF [bacterium]|nr:MAG: 23S rRNA pseudouridine(2604) synthase RluF [bacterium]
MRLNKAISDTGLCSRREADAMIEQGRVFVNGKKATIGVQVESSDEIRVDGRIIKDRTQDIYIALNKPVGIVSTTENTTKDNIIDYLNFPKRIFPIGRLDKDSEGLILLTNNGDIVNKILRAGNEHEKEYIVTVNKPISDEFVKSMSSGVPILGQVTKKCFVKKESEFVFRIILIQGLNRQIRRMCEHFGYDVVRLQRIRIMNVDLGKLAVGDWRELSDKELKAIFDAIQDSSDGAEKKQSKPKPKQSSKPKRNNEKPATGNSKKTFKSAGKENQKQKREKSSNRRGRGR